MLIEGIVLPVLLQALLLSIWLLVLGDALVRAPWAQLRINPQLHHLLPAATLGLFLLWNFHAGIPDGYDFHLIGLAVLTLAFGFRLAVIAASVASIALAFYQQQWGALAANAVLGVVVPIAIVQVVYTVVHLLLPHHIFLYIFLCGFFGSVLSAGFSVLASMALIEILNPQARLFEGYLPFVPLYLFAEGFLNGTLITFLIALRPQWLKTFDDERHLNH